MKKKSLKFTFTFIFSFLLILTLIFLQVTNGFLSRADGNINEDSAVNESLKAPSNNKVENNSTGKNDSKKSLVRIGETDVSDFTFDSFNDLNLTCNVVKYNGTDPIVVMPDTVDYNGKIYRITTSGAVFFTNNYVKSITTGRNLNKLGTNFASSCANLETVSLNEGITSIDGSSLQNDPKLVSCNLPESLISMGDWAFTNDTSLQRIDLPTNLTTMGYGAFQSCTSLKTLTFGADSKLSIIPTAAFAYCSNLQGIITIPKNVTEIKDTAFFACCSNGVSSLNFETGSKLTAIGEKAFESCKKMQGSLVLPEGLLSIGIEAFASTEISSLTIPSTLTSIPNGCFQYAKITDLTVPGTIKTIGKDAFSVNPIKKLILENGLETIAPQAFQFIQAKELIIPDTVTEIGYQAFWSGKLEKVVIPSQAKLGYQNFLYDAFSWNNLWDIEMSPYNAPIGIGDQTFNGQSIYKHLTYQTDIPVDDLFDVHIDGIDQAKKLLFSNMTNGVTYSNGSFHVPANVTRFVFNFDGYISSSGQEDKSYNGIYTVDFGDSNIRVRDVIVIQDSTWNPVDNFVSAVDNAGNDVPFSEITVNPTTVDTHILGTYPVEYSYQGSSSTANVIVTKRTTPTSSVKINYFQINDDGSLSSTPVPGAPVTPNIEGFVGLNWSFAAVSQIGDYELVGSSDTEGHFSPGLDTQNGTFKEDTGTNPHIDFYYAKKTSSFFTKAPPNLNFGSMHFNGSTNKLVNGPARLGFHIGSGVSNIQLTAQMSNFMPVGHGGPDVDGTIKINADNSMIEKDGNLDSLTKPSFTSSQYNISSTDQTATILFDSLTASNKGNWTVSFKSENTSLFIPRVGSAGNYRAKISWTVVSDYP